MCPDPLSVCLFLDEASGRPAALFCLRVNGGNTCGARCYHCQRFFEKSRCESGTSRALPSAATTRATLPLVASPSLAALSLRLPRPSPSRQRLVLVPLSRCFNALVPRAAPAPSAERERRDRSGEARETSESKARHNGAKCRNAVPLPPSVASSRPPSVCPRASKEL